MSYSHDVLHNVMDMGALSVLGTILNYKRDAYVHCQGPLNMPNIDCSSCRA